jgi:CarboxypepD_reg-like domain/Secretion system C-terminal sorting domain
MSKHIQLTIADPCHENWDHMTQAEKGRFCASCQKQVIDFTNMSDSQLAAFFKKPSEGSVCGRFFQDQLERDIQIPKKRIPWVKYFFQFALPAFLVSIKATAQGNVRTKPITATRSVPACSQLTGMVAPVNRIKVVGDTITAPFKKQNESAALQIGKSKINIEAVSSLISIKGIVVDQDNNPVPFASVMIKGGRGWGVSADSNGVFNMKKMVFEINRVLEVSSVGYVTKEITVNKEADLAKDIVIQLERRIIENVIVVSNQAIMGAFRVGGISIKRTEEKVIETPVIKSPAETPAMIKVYPNPVASGSSINIGCQKLKEGYYYLQLSAQSGQQVLNKQTWIDGEVQVLNIDIPNVAAGVYFLKLTNKETSKRFTAKVVIE